MPSFDFEARTRPFPQRVSRWRLRTRTLELPRRPLLMGIVNVTPDSFSDGGQLLDSGAAVAHALQLAADGADILDIGGESTRPYSAPVAADEELRRVLPVVESLAQQLKVPISIDTSKAIVARAAIDAGAEIINDVTGLQGDPEMVLLAAESGAGVCAMHMQGTPQTMQDNPVYGDVVAEVLEYLRQRRDALLSAGIAAERICLDPGIGFGKSHEHNLTLMAYCFEFHALGCPLLVGHSRKGFLAKLIGDKEADRTNATIGAALSLAVQGVQIIRVHDVRPVREALMAFEATGGLMPDNSQMVNRDKHTLADLRSLLHDMANIVAQNDPRVAISTDDIANLAFAFRDCRLELLRLKGSTFSEEQLHRLQQLDYRLQMASTGNAVVASIPSEAHRALAAFGWSEPNIDASTELIDT
jgi:dihydropteroate synthase